MAGKGAGLSLYFRDGREEVALIALRRHCRRDFGRPQLCNLLGMIGMKSNSQLMERFMDQFWLVLVRPAYILFKVANKNAVDNPHIKMPVKPSSGPNNRHSFGSTKSP
jgi:hypothetical protein